MRYTDIQLCAIDELCSEPLSQTCAASYVDTVLIGPSVYPVTSESDYFGEDEHNKLFNNESDSGVPMLTTAVIHTPPPDPPVPTRVPTPGLNTQGKGRAAKAPTTVPSVNTPPRKRCRSGETENNIRVKKLKTLPKGNVKKSVTKNLTSAPGTKTKKGITGQQNKVNSAHPPSQPKQLPQPQQDVGDGIQEIKNLIENITVSMTTMQTTLSTRIDTLEQNVTTRLENMIDNKIKKEFVAVKKDVGGMIQTEANKVRIEVDRKIGALKESLEVKLTAGHDRPERGSYETDNKKLNIVIKNLTELKEEEEEEGEKKDEFTLHNVKSLVRDGLKIADVQITHAQRKPTKGKYPGIVIATVDTLESKTKIMKTKSVLKYSEKFKNVYIDNDKTKKELDTERTLHTVLTEIGMRDKYRVSGARLLRRTGERDREHTYSDVVRGMSPHTQTNSNRERQQDRSPRRERYPGRGRSPTRDTNTHTHTHNNASQRHREDRRGGNRGYINPCHGFDTSNSNQDRYGGVQTNRNHGARNVNNHARQRFSHDRNSGTQDMRWR